MRKDANEAVGFQFGLVEALGNAWAWLLTNDEITELENLTLGQERENVKQWHWTSPVHVHVYFVGRQIMAGINHYMTTDLASLESKLAQYPGGTKFLLNISGPADRVDPVHAAIGDLAAEHGFELAPPEPVN